MTSGFMRFLPGDGWGDGIVASGVEGVASSDAGKAHPECLDGVEALEALEGVFRAGGVKPASGVRAENPLLERGNHPVGSNEQQEGKRERPHERTALGIGFHGLQDINGKPGGKNG